MPKMSSSECHAQKGFLLLCDGLFPVPFREVSVFLDSCSHRWISGGHALSGPAMARYIPELSKATMMQAIEPGVMEGTSCIGAECPKNPFVNPVFVPFRLFSLEPPLRLELAVLPTHLHRPHGHPSRGRFSKTRMDHFHPLRPKERRRSSVPRRKGYSWEVRCGREVARVGGWNCRMEVRCRFRSFGAPDFGADCQYCRLFLESPPPPLSEGSCQIGSRRALSRKPSLR